MEKGRTGRLDAEAGAMQMQDSGGDPTPAGLVGGGALVVVVATGGAAAAANGSDWIAPIIALIGAIFVAVLTAITTNRRQAKQLAAEQRRLTKQLAHERDLGELAHLREFFDEMADAFETWDEVADDTYDFVADAIKNHDGERDLERQQQLNAREVAAYARMGILHRRLGLRLPADHPVARAYRETSTALHNRASAVSDMAVARAIDEERSKELNALVMHSWRDFVDAARAELDRRAAAAE